MLAIRFIKVPPTTYLLQYRRGKLVREGVGLAFFYYAPSTSLVAIPMASTDVPFIFEELTGDYQNVTIQGQVNYRVGDPRNLSTLMNFALTRDGRSYLSKDPQELPHRVINIMHVLARAELQLFSLRQALTDTELIVN